VTETIAVAYDATVFEQFVKVAWLADPPTRLLRPSMIRRAAMGEKDFDASWAEGAALRVDDAIAYAQRGRSQRKRPASGSASLTPAERYVARLVCERLGNREIATRLFISPRTV
jgi:DNA-binding NarL/FixJ family response regulator